MGTRRLVKKKEIYPIKNCCGLIYTVEVKDNSKRAAAQIKRLATSKAEPFNYDRNVSVKIPRKNKARTSFLLARKQKVGKTPKYHGDQHY